MLCSGQLLLCFGLSWWFNGGWGLASLPLWNHGLVWQFSSTMKDKFWWGTCTILIISARNWEFAAQPVMFVTAWKSYAFNKKSLPEARNTREQIFVFFSLCSKLCSWYYEAQIYSEEWSVDVVSPCFLPVILFNGWHILKSFKYNIYMALH